MTRTQLMEMKVEDLRKVAKENQIKGISKLNKAELVGIIFTTVYQSEEAEEVSEAAGEEDKEVMIVNVNGVDHEMEVLHDDEEPVATEEVNKAESTPVVSNRDEAVKLIKYSKIWNKKERVRYTCPICGVRIYNPKTDNFCFNCGQRFEKEDK